MKIVKKTFLIFVFLAFFFVKHDTFSQDISSDPTLKIYYVPFRLQMFMNISMQRIEEASQLTIWIYDNDSLANEIFDLLKGEKPPKEIEDVPIEHFDIRVKIENVKDGSVYYVDVGGIVQTNKGDRFVLSEPQIEKLEAKIMSLRGVVQKRNALL